MTPEDQPKNEAEIHSESVFESQEKSAQEISELVIKKTIERGWSFKDPDEIGNFPMAVIEAAANAIKHGNHEMPDKKVTVETDIDAEHATVIIRDEGEGFDPGIVPNPIAEERLLQTSGRGVFLMRELCDKFEYRDGGRTVELTKYKTKPAKDGES